MPHPPVNRRNKQFHFYFSTGTDIVTFNEDLESRKIWHDLYHELFKPSEHLEKLIQQADLPQSFASVHVRFLNSLEQAEDKRWGVPISKAEQQKLIDGCLQKLEEIRRHEDNKPVYVFSDNRQFSEIAANNGFNVLTSGSIGHVSLCENNDAVYDRTFTDFYAMSRSSAIYKIVGPYVYYSGFSRYASFVGNTLCNVVYLGQ